MGEREEKTMKGTFIDLFDEYLGIVKDLVLAPGSMVFWYDAARIDKSTPAFLIASSARAEGIIPAQRTFAFTLSGPSEMTAAVRVWTKRRPKSVTADSKETLYQYDEPTGTTYFEYLSEGRKVKIKIAY